MTTLRKVLVPAPSSSTKLFASGHTWSVPSTWGGSRGDSEVQSSSVSGRSIARSAPSYCWEAWEESAACIRLPATTITATKAQDRAMVMIAATWRRSGVSFTGVRRAISDPPAGPRR